MQIIDHNPDKTVGIVGEVEGIEHIGGFAPEVFFEWVKAIEAAFELQPSGTIHLFTKKSSDVESYALFASCDGKDPLVVMSGKIPADGKPWGKVYEGDKK